MHTTSIEIKRGIILTDIATKKAKEIRKVDLKGVYFNDQTEPVPLLTVISKIRDKMLVKQ